MTWRSPIRWCFCAGLLLVAMLPACHDNPTAPTCTYTVVATTRAFTAQGGTTDLVITATSACAWTAASDAAWAVVATPAGTGTATVRVTVAANPDFASRQATIRIAGQTIALTQDGLAPCTYALAPASQSIAAAGGTATVDVTTQGYCAWSATAADAWLTIQGDPSRQGAGTITFAVAQNTGAAERTTTIRAGGQTATVRQAGAAPCAYTVTPAGQAFGPAGGSGIVTVQAAAGCAWSANPSDTWIRITSTSIQPVTGNGTVRFDVDVNSGSAAREGRITVGNQSFVVSQAGVGECSYAVSPVEFTLHWHEVTGNIQVSTQAGCPWSAATADSWLTLTSGSTGSGSGTVGFAMTALTMDATRRGPVKVRWPTATAGQNVWVTQEGCRYGTLSTLAIPAAGIRQRVDVYTQPISQGCAIGCTWTAESTVAWMRVVSGSPNAGDNPFTIEVDANTTGAERVGTLRVNDRTITVTQAK